MLIGPAVALGSAPTPPPAEQTEDAGPEMGLDAQVEALRKQVQQLEEEVRLHRDARANDATELINTGGHITVKAGQSVDEAVAIWHDVHVYGHVSGDAVSVGGSVVVHAGGSVGGDVVSWSGTVTVEDGGHVGGDRVALALSDPTPPPGAAANNRHATGSLVLAGRGEQTLRWLYHRLVWMLTIAGAGVVTVGLFPDRVARVAADVESRPLRAAFVGTAATAFISLFTLLFVAVTFGVGSPIALAVVAALAVAWLLGFVAFCEAIGNRLPVASRVHGRWMALAAGVALLSFVGSLPWVGWLGLAGISMVGIGAALSTRYGAA